MENKAETIRPVGRPRAPPKTVEEKELDRKKRSNAVNKTIRKKHLTIPKDYSNIDSDTLKYKLEMAKKTLKEIEEELKKRLRDSREGD